MVRTLNIKTGSQGLYEITHQLKQIVDSEDIDNGLCTVFIRHTSASLLIQENADPSCQSDLENWLNRLVPEHDSLYTHVMEGPDDMPAHIKSTLTASSVAIPIMASELVLGTWQGVFVWEHRHRAAMRQLVVHISD